MTYIQTAFSHLLQSSQLDTIHPTLTFFVFFFFFQMRDFIKKQFPHFPNRPPETLINILLNMDPNQRKGISVICGSMNSVSLDLVNRVKNAWESDLGTDLLDEHWKCILDLVHSSPICARHGLIQCKILHRIHYTNARLSKIFPDVHDSCNRCKQSPANHIHMFWSYPKLINYWSNIFETISLAYGVVISPSALSAIFGVPPNTGFPAAAQRALAFTTLLVRHLI